MLICPSAWPPSQPTCLRCFLPASTIPNTSLNLSSGLLPPIWSMPTRNGVYLLYSTYVDHNTQDVWRWVAFPLLSSLCFISCSPHPYSKLDNGRSVTSGGVGPHVHVEFCQYVGQMSSYVDYRVCPDVASAEGKTDICQRFSVSLNRRNLLFLPNWQTKVNSMNVNNVPLL